MNLEEFEYKVKEILERIDMSNGMKDIFNKKEDERLYSWMDTVKNSMIKDLEEIFHDRDNVIKQFIAKDSEHTTVKHLYIYLTEQYNYSS